MHDIAKPKRKPSDAQKSEKSNFRTIFNRKIRARVSSALMGGLDPTSSYEMPVQSLCILNGIWESTAETEQGGILITDTSNADYIDRAG
ncbi:hypothetical protein [Massilia sp. 9096]|uniref:hypothetical protein n=1 Tax=Massilia sp. 9096 TaxID=1500894 RepID=UPI00055E6803|nr:hypothetical protein [Massilia sp. 9096]